MVRSPVTLWSRKMSEQFMRFRQVEAATGMGRSQLYRNIKAGLFPKQVRIGPGSVAWRSSEIEAWQAAIIAASRDAEDKQ
jgi:prophage regulatory protein